MAYNSQSARFADILLAVKTRLVTVLDCDPAVVRIVSSDRYDLQVPGVGDYALFLRPFGPEPDTNAGAGRQARMKKRLLRVHFYYRNSSDQAGEDEVALTAEDGLLDLEDLVVDALDDWWPKTAGDSPTVMTIEPLHPLNSAEGPPLRKEEDDTGWSLSHSDFEIHYVSRNSIPAP